MTSSVYSKLAGRLSTMGGFPAWSDQMSENYFGDLSDVPDDIGRRMIQEIGRRFDERPSAKNLRDWARSLGPQAAFDIKQLEAKPEYRPGGMSTPGLAALAGAQSTGRASTADKLPIPDSAKAVFRELQARDKADRHRGHIGPAVTGDWGLEYQYPDGKIERFPARHSEEEARRRQAEACRKYSHFTCRVYRKSVAVFHEKY